MRFRTFFFAGERDSVGSGKNNVISWISKNDEHTSYTFDHCTKIQQKNPYLLRIILPAK